MSDQPGGRESFLKDYCLSLEKEVGIQQVQERSSWTFQSVEWHVRRLRSIRFYRKPLNALGHEAGAVLEVEEEEISKPGKS